jgi:predicted nucleic acid-binding protein
VSSCTAHDVEFAPLAQAVSLKLVTNDREILESFPGAAVSLESFAQGSG